MRFSYEADMIMIPDVIFILDGIMLEIKYVLILFMKDIEAYMW